MADEGRIREGAGGEDSPAAARWGASADARGWAAAALAGFREALVGLPPDEPVLLSAAPSWFDDVGNAERIDLSVGAAARLWAGGEPDWFGPRGEALREAFAALEALRASGRASRGEADAMRALLALAGPDGAASREAADAALGDGLDGQDAIHLLRDAAGALGHGAGALALCVGATNGDTDVAWVAPAASRPSDIGESLVFLPNARLAESIKDGGISALAPPAPSAEGDAGDWW